MYMYVISKIPVMYVFHSSSADSGAQVQRLRKTSPIRNIHIAQVETLIKDKEGQHEGDCTCDETSLLYNHTCMHGPCSLTYRTGS